MSINKAEIGTIVGETNPLAFKFLINKEVGRGTYVKARTDGGKDWILAQVEDVKRSNSAYSVNQLSDGARNYDSREMMIAEARVIGVGKAPASHQPGKTGRSGFHSRRKADQGHPWPGQGRYVHRHAPRI